jgi:gas vesicle protein
LRSTKFSRDEILAAIGLETKKSVSDYLLPALGIFGVGLVVGSGVALLFAPKSGSELRGDLGRGAGNLAGRVRFRRRRNGGVDLHRLSRDELYERAKAMGIEGRSEMSRDQLISAISSH